GEDPQETIPHLRCPQTYRRFRVQGMNRGPGRAKAEACVKTSTAGYSRIRDRVNRAHQVYEYQRCNKAVLVSLESSRRTQYPSAMACDECERQWDLYACLVQDAADSIAAYGEAVRARNTGEIAS